MQKLVLAMIVLSSCAPKVPTGECLGYACDGLGARTLLEDTLTARYSPSESARKSFNVVFDGAVSRMGKEGFQPEGFDLAKANLEKFLSDVPEVGDDALSTEAKSLADGTAKACPLWPYC